LERLEDRQRVGHREIDEIREPPSLDAHGPALGAEAFAVACRARPQRAVRLERLLVGPGALLESAPQTRKYTFEVSAEGIFRNSRRATIGAWGRRLAVMQAGR